MSARSDTDAHPREKKDNFWSVSGVFAIAAGLGLLCCGIPLLFAAGAGGIFGFVGGGTALTTVAAIGTVGAVVYLARRDRRRSSQSGKDEAMTDNLGLAHDCCATQWDAPAESEKQTSRIDPGKTEKDLKQMGRVGATGEERAAPRIGAASRTV